ncbi:MAG: aminotransferase class I/II-fold pyridoxal phosphate-dependent enzyme [Lachnospiraceae bacterium]|nr:aminotransferase class I/II-fold pyridoxal phosphate-dependent enzyme [Lachnospiraceae bacterium]
MRMGLFESLKKYSGEDFYPFHMPGHKRNPESGPFAEMYRLDITEIDGFDNLHQPELIIKDAQERAAGLYYSEDTYFLVNGSTAGILSAVSAAAGRGKKLIIARNCHKAVYHAAFLNRMELYYVYPQIVDGYEIAGAVLPEDIECTIKEILGREEEKDTGGIAGVVITSPTYDGMVSDVKKISDLVHSYGILLIVDQAHGAHFGLHPAYPQNAVREGADLVIHSLHKTLPAPTQTALLHRNGKLADKDLLEKYLRIYQSSSPSYLLMAGIDEAIAMAEKEGEQRLGKLLDLRNQFLKEIQGFSWIHICPFTEPGKLVISVKGCPVTGQILYDTLREKYHLQMEMASGNYVLAILSMMDRKEGFERLLAALREIDGEIQRMYAGGLSDLQRQGRVFGRKMNMAGLQLRLKADLNIWEAYTSPFEEVAMGQAAGRISAGFINLYPPGIPLAAPGEVLDEQVISIISDYLDCGYHVQGICENKIKVVDTCQ